MTSRHARPARALVAVVLAALVGVGAVGCGGFVIDRSDPTHIVIGSAPFAESEIVANIYAEALTAAGYSARANRPLANREGYFPVVMAGAIGVVPEYVGALLTYLEPSADTMIALSENQALDRLRAHLPAELAVAAPAPAQNRDLLVVTERFATDHGVSTISQLAPLCSRLVFGGPKTFTERFQGLRGLDQVYGCVFERDQGFITDDNTVIRDLRRDRIQVARWFETSPELDDPGLVALDDDRHLFLNQNVLPLYRRDSLTAEQVAVLDSVSADLTTDDLRRLVRAHTDGAPVDDIAREWLHTRSR